MSHPLLFFCGLWMLGLGLRSLRWSPRVAWRTCPVGPLKVVRWPRPPPRGPCAVPHLIGNGVDSKQQGHRTSSSHPLSTSGTSERSTNTDFRGRPMWMTLSNLSKKPMKTMNSIPTGFRMLDVGEYVGWEASEGRPCDHLFVLGLGSF